MRISLTVLLVTSVSLGACGFVRDSALNPGNWFGRSTSEQIEVADEKPVNPLIPSESGLFARIRADEATYEGRPFDEIVSLKVERVPGGAIIRATGRADRQGIYSVRLTPADEDEKPVKGVLTYRLEGIKPDANTPVGGTATREVTAARKLTDQDLRGVRSIRVEGARNARVARR
ncbi:hypothetical protein [Sulfitobacter donghicola]|uniref:Lipoprotein n=1 Tax=Sulfitobacter donghicola DSW-25 = KCTC 12864 = JCM 14565 TaxID=1300350 RepID=A0A073IER2_9RHOB|nr:hypothetical protein [Sulfitobacter donghicola]KEJ87971.1 hypothetical protein DSW25_03915 [Sulfitobacter donghicola DSW-25 = KCTC 12864 = JCM 14565]KIN69481.1 putative, lipoprotein [Sulfitobacter donghicola DSW-25 = KCTC 12864 = JCM 14565]